MDPLTLALIAGSAVIGGVLSYNQASKQNEAIDQTKQQVEENTALQLQTLLQQKRQAEAATAEEIVQRKVQGLKTEGATQAWQAALGVKMSSSTMQAIFQEVGQDVQHDINIIQQNLENYMAQAYLQELQIQKSSEAQINQLEAQKSNVLLETASGALKGGTFMTNMEANYNVTKTLKNVFGSIKIPTFPDIFQSSPQPEVQINAPTTYEYSDMLRNLSANAFLNTVKRQIETPRGYDYWSLKKKKYDKFMTNPYTY